MWATPCSWRTEHSVHMPFGLSSSSDTPLTSLGYDQTPLLLSLRCHAMTCETVAKHEEILPLLFNTPIATPPFSLSLQNISPLDPTSPMAVLGKMLADQVREGEEPDMCRVAGRCNLLSVTATRCFARHALSQPELCLGQDFSVDAYGLSEIATAVMNKVVHGCAIHPSITIASLGRTLLEQSLASSSLPPACAERGYPQLALERVLPAPVHPPHWQAQVNVE